MGAGQPRREVACRTGPVECLSMSKKTPATSKPVVRVLPLLGVSHLDRPFDYLVDEESSDACQPGTRVRIRFHAQLVDAVVLERLTESDFDGSLRFIDRVISPYIVYPQRTAKLIDALADRYGGNRSDIIRTAIPPRHAKAEESDFSLSWDDLGESSEPDLSGWSAYQHGESFVDFVLSGNPARAAWQIAPGDDWAACLAALAVKVARDGGGSVIVVPHQRDLDRLESALRELVAAKQVTVLSNSLGPQARYRRYLTVVVGQARIVIGTRSAAFAPVENLRLAVVLHDGDDNLVDNLKPYVHVREVLTTRSAQEGCSLIVAGYSRTAETQLLVDSGWMHDLVASDSVLSKRAPTVTPVGTYGLNLARESAASTSMHSSAYQAIRGALDRDEPVLVLNPRKGYVPTLACGHCRSAARCRNCNGPLSLPQGESASVSPQCGWCGHIETRHSCTECGSTRLRAVVLGSERTAEELGRAFPSTRVIISGGNKVVPQVPNKAALVIATPGAEPEVEEGLYGAAVMLDTGALLSRQDLRATERAFATWIKAAAQVKPGLKGGEVILAADQELPVVGYMTRWDVVGAAQAELTARREVRLPPAVHFAAIDGADASIDMFLELAELPEHAEVLGPVPLPPGTSLPGDYDAARFGPPQRIVVRTPLGPRSELGKALRQANAARSTRKDELPLRIQVDPVNVG